VIIFSRGKPKQRGRQLLPKELPVQTARESRAVWTGSVMILEGGFRGWEAHDLPIQQTETTLSQKACDQLALKVGKDVSKLTC